MKAEDRKSIMEALEMARELIQEAKGADGDMAFVTAHLDEAENWLDKVGTAIIASA